MKPPFPCPTPTWHNDSYAAISPSRPELSASGKTVIVTGAGSGIGRETAKAFAAAGAARVALLGRTESTLRETQAQLGTTASIASTHRADLSDEASLRDAAATIGTWDVLVLNGAGTTTPSPLATADAAAWWGVFEVNVRGTMLSIAAFAGTARQEKAAVLGVTTVGITVPPAMLPGLSAYAASKLAQAKLLEFVAAEHPELFVASIHPGCIATDTFFKNESKEELCPMDTARLPAHFLVWMCSPEAAFLRGRTAWANWDVNELKAQAEEIKASQQMTSGTLGWPFPHVG